MEIEFNKQKYTEEILSLLNSSQIDKRKEVETIIDKMAKIVSLQTFERNMHHFPLEDLHVRRI